MSNATLAADQALKWALAGAKVTWTNHQPATSLVAWSRNKAKGVNAAPPAFDTNLSMVCYELPIWAAYHSGVLSADALYDLVREFDATGHGSAAAIMAAITSGWSSRKTLTNVTEPAFGRGDIVFFNGVGHVALASGNKDSANEVYSVWGLDPSGTKADTPVEKTTVEKLLAQIAAGAPGLAQTITYSTPKW